MTDNKQFTIFVDNVVGNPPRLARLRRIHAVASGLLKISPSEDFAALAAAIILMQENLRANRGNQKTVGEARQIIRA